MQANAQALPGETTRGIPPQQGGPKRVGIVTVHFVPNYGSVWQAYALQRYIEQLGHEAVMIHYCPSHVYEGCGFWWPWSKWRIRANVVIAYQRYQRIRNRFTGWDRVEKLYQGFVQEQMNLTARYRTLRELRRNPPDVDALVCGSDQIWNPSVQYGIDPAYFLDFAPPAIPRIAYAPSFGRSSVDERFEGQIAGLIRKLSHVSVREASGAAIVRRLTGRHAATVPDPTLLHDDYPLATEPAEAPERYIFSYVLRSGEAVNAVQRGVAQSLGLPILSPINPHTIQSRSDIALMLDPRAWLGAIKRASYVITNSFHGTVFSILCRRPFVTVGIGSGKEALNERMLSLLTRLDLMDRFVVGSDAARIGEALNREIDWNSVYARLAMWREEARQYLSTSLATEVGHHAAH